MLTISAVCWVPCSSVFLCVDLPSLQVKLLPLVLSVSTVCWVPRSRVCFCASTCLCCKSSCCSWCSAPQRCAVYLAAVCFLRWLAFTVSQVVALGAQHLNSVLGTTQQSISHESTCLCCKSSGCSWCSAPQQCAGYLAAVCFLL